jgi:hypothetical protein
VFRSPKRGRAPGRPIRLRSISAKACVKRHGSGRSGSASGRVDVSRWHRRINADIIRVPPRRYFQGFATGWTRIRHERSVILVVGTRWRGDSNGPRPTSRTT